MTEDSSRNRLEAGGGGHRLSYILDQSNGTVSGDQWISKLIIAGWTGRDREAVDLHIKELAALGVAPPASIPVYYRAAAQVLTQEDQVQFMGRHASGEAEAVMITTDQGMLLMLGSDHTDRRLEAWSVSASKQACAKPLSRQAWRFEDIVDVWDDLELTSYIVEDGQRILYQNGVLAELLAPGDLLNGLGAKQLEPGIAIFGGTLSAIGGVRPASRFEAALTNPHTGRSLTLAYDCCNVPDVLDND